MRPQYNNGILDLLNYEGPVLTCEKCVKDDLFIATELEDQIYYFIIKDQYNMVLDVISYEVLISFFEGDYSFTDSNGKTWNYLKESIDAKPSIDEINLFLYSNDTI